MIRKIKFQNLFSYYDCYRFSMQLDVLAWMVRTGAAYREAQTGMFEWLFGLSAWNVYPRYCHEYPIPATNAEDFLTMAFVRAVVDTSAPEFVCRWREVERVSMESSRYLEFAPEVVWPCNLWALTNYKGKQLNVSLNSIHPEMRLIRSVNLVVDQAGWNVLLRYGDEQSEYTHYLLESRTSSARAILTATKRLGGMTVEGVQ